MLCSEISSKARNLHFRSIVIDTHVDTAQRLVFDQFDLGTRHSDGSVDIPRMREGGVSAVFFAVWTPGNITGPSAVKRAHDQFDAVQQQVALHANELMLASTADDIHRAYLSGKIALLMAVEGGHLIDSDLDVLRTYFQLGARYLTLTHALNVEWADASTDQPKHNGLTEFGKQVIQEMNRLGMMVDISHVSDKTFYDVLAISQAPVIATHSSCRARCDSPRDMSDEMIRVLAAEGGVIQINFHVGFLSQKFRDAWKANPELQAEIDSRAKEQCGENQACQLIEAGKLIREFVTQGKLPRVEWTDIVDHIDHAVKLVGPDHVGFGSDFDGADMPYGMEDASHLPQITDALLEKGYSENDIQKILGGNILRLMQDVEAIAHKMEGTT
jgi:membrane dipeptidase